MGADSACPAVYQQSLTGGQTGRRHEIRPHRAGHLGQCRRILQWHPGRDGQYLRRGYGHQFGISAAGQQGAHLLALGESSDVRTDSYYGARDLKSQNVTGARWGWVLPGGLQQVGSIHPRRTDRDQHLPGAGAGVRHLLPPQLSRFVRDDAVHAVQATAERIADNWRTTVQGARRVA